MKKGNKWLVAMGIMIVTLSGCQANTHEMDDSSVVTLPEEVTTESQETALSQENAEQQTEETVELVITHEKGHYLTEDGSQELLVLDVATPRIVGGNQSVADVFNAASEERRSGIFSHIEGKSESVDGGMEQHMLQMANEEYKFYRTDDWYAPYQYLGGYTVARFDDKVLSMTDETYIYMGGAHGSNLVTGLTIDMETGEEIYIEDIATDAEPFRAICEEEIKKQIKEKQEEGIQFFETYEDFIREIIANDTFYLTEKGVCFISQEYMLQPYASGTVHFEIPYEVFGELMNDEYIPKEKKVTYGVKEEEIALPERLYELDFNYDVAMPILNQVLSGMALSYMYEGTDKITELSEEVMLSLLAGAIIENYAYDEFWYDEMVGGYKIPQDVLDQYSKELFGKTLDLTQFAANQQYGMALISENHEYIALVGDWGMAYPTYEVVNCEESADGKYHVDALYGVVDYEENEGSTTKYMAECEMTFSPSDVSKYGYVLTQMCLTNME